MPDFTEGLYVTKDAEIERLRVDNARLTNENVDLKSKNNTMRVELADLQTRIAQIGNIAR